MSCLISKKIPKTCAFGVGGISQLWLANWEEVNAGGGFSDSDADDIYDTVTFVTVAITDVTQANPAVVTAAGHGLSTGDIIEIVGTSPMDGLVGQHTVGGVTSADEFELAGFDSSSLAAFGASSVSVQKGAFYEIEFLKEQASFSAELVKSNGNTYSNHTANFNTQNITQGAQEQMNQLALGKLIAVYRDNNGKYVILGRVNGLEATVINLSSGAADGDARGYQVTLVGGQPEFPPEWDNTVNGLPTSLASV